MLFNLKFQEISVRGKTSGEIRKILSGKGLSVKDQKECISKAIQGLRGESKNFHVKGRPHVTVVRSSVSKPKKQKGNGIEIDLETVDA